MEKKFSVIDFVIAYEAGELDLAKTVEGFQYLLDNDIIRELQGHYQRTASDLLAQGLITSAGYQATRMNKYVHRLAKRYIGARTAHKYETLWVWSREYGVANAGYTMLEDEDERSDCWAELEEVCYHFNGQNDGCVYYVGDASGEPVRPSYAELTEIAQYVASSPQSSFTSIELLAFKLHEVQG